MIIKLRHSGQQPQLKQISEQRSLIRKREGGREGGEEEEWHAGVAG